MWRNQPERVWSRQRHVTGFRLCLYFENNVDRIWNQTLVNVDRIRIWKRTLVVNPYNIRVYIIIRIRSFLCLLASSVWFYNTEIHIFWKTSETSNMLLPTSDCLVSLHIIRLTHVLVSWKKYHQRNLRNKIWF